MSADKAMVTDCDCTKVAQDETCPVGYPSLLCSVCDGKGVLSAALAQAEQPVAYSYRLARSIAHHDDGTKEYLNFDEEPRLSRVPPCVPEGAIRDFTPLYAHPPAKREAGELLREALDALEEIASKDREGFGRPALGAVARRAIRSIKPRAALEASHE